MGKSLASMSTLSRGRLIYALSGYSWYKGQGLGKLDPSRDQLGTYTRELQIERTMPTGRDRYFESMMTESKRDQLEAEAKLFHDFLLHSEALSLGRIVSRVELKELFAKFRYTLDFGPNMKFEKYITVMVHFVGGLKMHRKFESFKICPWPPSMTHEELVEYYLEQREKCSGSYRTLINSLLCQSNGKILRYDLRILMKLYFYPL